MFGRLVSWLARRAVAAETAIDLDKREALRAAPFPAHWIPIVAEVSQTAGLDAEQRAKLYRDINVFLGEKRFVGVDDFPVDDHVRVIVATSAAVLVIGRDIAQFDHVREIRIHHEIDPRVGGLYQVIHTKLGDEIIDTHGIVELGWRAVREGLVRPEGQHTAFHEFAHAFDHADGELDALMSHQHFARWSALLQSLPLHQRREGNRVFTEVIGDAAGPELFSSASELFFECPRRLYKLDAGLFDALVEIYAFDPRTLTDR